MEVAFLGFGLIGGSVARALRAGEGQSEVRIRAWTPAGRGPRAAASSGIVDLAADTPGAALDGAALVVLAAPPMACIALLERLGGDLRPSLAAGATVTDVASTKLALLAAARRAGVPYVGGHPMAGREASGFDAADAGLFRDRPWIVTEAVGGGDPAAVRDLAARCGARVIEMQAATHDVLVAGISHLPLLASVALVEAVAGRDAPEPDWDVAAALAAGGWRDTTRIARGDPTMGAEIAATNAVAVSARLRAYRARIDEWLALLEDPAGPDVAAMRSRLEAARARLER